MSTCANNLINKSAKINLDFPVHICTSPFSQSQLSITSPLTLLVCLLCPLVMSSQTSALSQIKSHYEKVPPSPNSRSHQKW